MRDVLWFNKAEHVIGRSHACKVWFSTLFRVPSPTYLLCFCFLLHIGVCALQIPALFYLIYKVIIVKSFSIWISHQLYWYFIWESRRNWRDSCENLSFEKKGLCWDTCNRKETNKSIWCRLRLNLPSLWSDLNGFIILTFIKNQIAHFNTREEIKWLFLLRCIGSMSKEKI